MKIVYIVLVGIAAISVQAQPFKRPYPGCPVVEHVTPEEYDKSTRPFQFAIEKTQEGVWTVRLSAEYSPDEYGEAKFVRVIISNVKPPEENTKDKDFGYIHNAQKDIAATYEVPLPSKDRRMTLRRITVRSSEMPRAILLVCYEGKDGPSVVFHQWSYKTILLCAALARWIFSRMAAPSAFHR